MVRKWGAPGDLIQDATWPGVPRVEEFTYTCSHGIHPGTAQLVTAPADPDDPDVAPAAFGNLYFTDGFRTVCLRDCKADRIDASYSRAGVTYALTILDRRWKWRNQFGGLGGMSGRYNQTDARGKLVPWSIRSPEEMAKLCLKEMGETNYVLVLPEGLRKADGANIDRFLRLGEQFPYTQTNPEFNWDHTPPAECLLQLADYFGCRVVFQPHTNRVLIVPLGYGIATLPDWPFEMDTPNVDDPETPESVGVYGSPMRIQCRLPLEPVGEEWDGSHLPIDQLSYAPKVAASASYAAAGVFDRTWKATNVGQFFDVTATDRLAFTESRGKAVRSVFKRFRVLRGKYGVPCAADSRKPPLILPSFGEVKRVQQLTLQPAKVEQIVPQARIAGGKDKGNLISVAGTVAGQGVLPEFYTGRSRDQVATVTGRIWKRIGSVFWDGNPVQNTKTSDRVFVPFSVTTDEMGDQLVEFADYVYEFEPQLPAKGYIKYPVLTLECSVLVTTEEEDQLVRWEKRLQLGGLAPVEWHAHPDLQVNVVGEYDTYSNPGSLNPSPLPDGKIHRLAGWHYAKGDKEHADGAADDYLKNHAKKYETVVGATRQFVGVRAISPDGTVHQVTWAMNRQGPTTVASVNSEHATNVPPFPLRRRAELLPPDRAAAAANQAEFALIKRLFPAPGGNVR